MDVLNYTTHIYNFYFSGLKVDLTMKLMLYNAPSVRRP